MIRACLASVAFGVAIHTVFTYVNVSEDGGKSFKELMPAYNANNGVHPDHHAWWIHPEDGSFMIDGNDGGLNITRDGGASWRFIGNIWVKRALLPQYVDWGLPSVRESRMFESRS